MAGISWTGEAHRWLHDIHAYIAADHPDAAQKVVSGIYEKAQALRQFPEIGHKYRTEAEGEISIFALWTLPDRIPSEAIIQHRHLGRLSRRARHR